MIFIIAISILMPILIQEIYWQYKNMKAQSHKHEQEMEELKRIIL